MGGGNGPLPAGLRNGIFVSFQRLGERRALGVVGFKSGRGMRHDGWVDAVRGSK
jgi:hypothetical protein